MIRQHSGAGLEPKSLPLSRQALADINTPHRVSQITRPGLAQVDQSKWDSTCISETHQEMRAMKTHTFGNEGPAAPGLIPNDPKQPRKARRNKLLPPILPGGGTSHRSANDGSTEMEELRARKGAELTLVTPNDFSKNHDRPRSRE